MEYNDKDLNAIQIVKERAEEILEQDRMLEQIMNDQIGTDIPRTFTSLKHNFIIDPSNVGTGIIDRMIKTDDTINSAVQFKIMMIMSKIGEYEHEDKNIQAFVQAFLNDFKEPTWQAAMESMLSYHGYKFSVTEIVYEIDDELRKKPIKLSTYHPSTIAFEVDRVGEITPDGILQYTQQRGLSLNVNARFQSIRHGFRVVNPFTTPVDRLFPYRVPVIDQLGLVRIPKSKVIHLVGQQWHGFGNPYGNSGVRTAHLLWQLKVFMLKQMGILAKRKGSPKIHGNAPAGMQKVEVTKPDGSKAEVSTQEALRLMLQDIVNTDSIVTGPETDGWKLTVLDDSIDPTAFSSVINELNTWMFRCFLLPSLVMTDGSAGSRALGDKHFEIVDRIAEADAEKFTENIINQMIERVILENFGPQIDYGKFGRRPQTTEERLRLASMFGQLANDGWMSPAFEADMRQVRDSLHLAADDDGFFKGQDNTRGLFDDFEPGEKIEPSPEEIKIQEREAASNQIDDIVKIMKAVKEGEISNDAARGLLISIGVDPANAAQIAAGGEVPEPASSPNPEPQPDPAPEQEELARFRTFFSKYIEHEPERLAIFLRDKINE